MKYHHNWIDFDGQNWTFPGYELIPNENKYTHYIETHGDGNLKVGQANICIAVKAMFFGVMRCWECGCPWCKTLSKHLSDEKPVAKYYCNSCYFKGHKHKHVTNVQVTHQFNLLYELAYIIFSKTGWTSGAETLIFYDKILLYHGCWCLDFLWHQDISNYVIDYAGSWGISITCAILAEMYIYIYA